MCTAMHLEAGKEYIMFLSEAHVKNNKTFFIQTDPSDLKTNIPKYMDICDLDRKYLEGILYYFQKLYKHSVIEDLFCFNFTYVKFSI